MKKQSSLNTRSLVLLALLTAIVFVLQYISGFMRFGPFSITLVLMPVVIGAAITGIYAGGWLGLVFGFAVLATGDATPFMTISPLATVLIVLVKGAAAGLAAGAVYKLFAGKNKTIAVILAAAVCPIVNTGVFVLGSYAFFMPTITEWGKAAGFASGAAFLFLSMIGINFLIELGINTVFSPVIVRLIQQGQKSR